MSAFVVLITYGLTHTLYMYVNDAEGVDWN